MQNVYRYRTGYVPTYIHLLAPYSLEPMAIRAGMPAVSHQLARSPYLPPPGKDQFGHRDLLDLRTC